MNLPVLIDVGLGLAVVFFLLATIGSIIVELIAGKCRWRHQELQRTIAKLVGAGYEKKNRRQGPFWEHAIILPLGTLDKDGPGYLSSERFATVALDLVLGGAAAGTVPASREAIRVLIQTHGGHQPRLRDSILALLRTVPADDPDPLATLRGATAHWYDEAMQRTTGAYKRKVQAALFMVGLGAALLLNVDAVRIAQVLYRDPDLRKATAEFAVETAKNHRAPTEISTQINQPAPAEDKSIEEARKDLAAEVKNLRNLAGIGFPIGWVTPLHLNFSPMKADPAHRTISWKTSAVFSKVLGFLATAFAVCLGAPFWFDLLNKLVKLRSSGGGGAPTPAPVAATGAAGAPNATGAGGGGAIPATGGAGAAPVSTAVALAKARKTEPAPFGPALAEPHVEFSPAKALRLAEVARLAYEKPLDGGDAAVPGTFKTHATGAWGCTAFTAFTYSNQSAGLLHQIDTQAYLILAPGIAVLAFRGTEATAPADFVTDAKFGLVTDPAFPGKIHSGFKEAFAAVYDDRPATKTEPAFSGIKSAIAQLAGSGRLLYVTGHSLGAALATLAACRIAQERLYRVQAVYTYGSPRVGDIDFAAGYAQLLGDRTYRVVNNEDVVTRAPPPIPGKLDYKHVGEIVYIDDSANLQRDIGFWYRALNFTANAVGGGVAAAGKRALSDHDMILYIAQLTKAARNGAVA